MIGYLRANHPARQVDVRAQRRETLDGLVDGAVSDVATAGHGHAGGAHAPQKHRNQIIGRAHLPNQLIGRIVARDAARVDTHHAVLERDVRAQPYKYITQTVHIVDIRQVLDRTGRIGEQRRGNDGHGRVLAAAYRHFTLQANAPVDQ